MAIKTGTKLISKADEKLLKKLGVNIRKARESKGLTVYDVTGEDMEIKSRQHWQKIENGQKNINFSTLMKIARTLELGADKLLRNI